MAKFDREEQPKEKRGNKYKIISDGEGLPIGTIVVLSYNDDSRCPFFDLIGEGGHENYCIWWDFLEPYEDTPCLGGE